MSMIKSRSIPRRLDKKGKLSKLSLIPKSSIPSKRLQIFNDYIEELFNDSIRGAAINDALNIYMNIPNKSNPNFNINEFAFRHKIGIHESILLISIALVINEMITSKNYNTELLNSVLELPIINENDCQMTKCRICERDIPNQYFEKHTEFCRNAHTACHKLIENTDKIDPFMDSLYAVDIILKKRVREIINNKTPISLVALELINASLGELSHLQYISKAVTTNVSSLLTKRLYLIRKIRLLYLLEKATEGEMADLEHFISMPEAERTINSFHVINPIAKGGYGRVSLCEKAATGDLFAIKMISKDDLDKRNGYSQALLEKDSMIKGMSAHVVQLYYTFQAENYLYLVMEFMPGGDLYSLLSNVGSLDEETLKFYAVEIASALGHLHSKEIVHCDLKPDNLLISEDGHIKLGDFGLSKIAFEGGFKATHDNKAEGTPEYLAPEVLSKGMVSPAADWWSFGAILYEMAEGVPPFTGETAEEVFENVLKGKYEWTSDVSESLKDLVKGLLTIDPNERMTYDDVIHHPFFSGVSWNDLNDGPAPFSPQRKDQTDVSYFQCARHSLVNSLSLNNLASFEEKAVTTKYYDLWDGMNYYALAELNQKIISKK